MSDLLEGPRYDPVTDTLTWLWRGNVEHYKDKITVHEETAGYVLRSSKDGAAVGVQILKAAALYVTPVLLSELLQAQKLNHELLQEEGDPYSA